MLGKFIGVISRVFMALLFFISVLGLLYNFANTPHTSGVSGYEQYLDILGARGIPGIFGPISIVVMLVGGFTLLIGYKIKISAYVLSAFSFIWAYFYLQNFLDGMVPPAFSLTYLAICGGLLYMANNPETGYSIDGCKKNK